MLLKKLRPSEVVGAHFPNALPTQQLDDLHVSHQSQVTRHGLSYGAFLLSSATIPGEKFNCVKRFAVVREEGLCEVIFDKDPDPPLSEIQH